jgi:superfamily I DNA/RNA helicase
VEETFRPRLLAVRLLRWWSQREDAAAATATATISTPLDELVAALGLDIATFAPGLHPDTLGYLEPGEDLIFLQSGLSEPVRRFTLAHELGHAVLHRGAGSPAAVANTLLGLASPGIAFDTCSGADLDAPADFGGISDETLRPGQAYSARARRESEANAFAASLLMPAERVRAFYLGAGGADQVAQSAAPSARALAEAFGVSEEVALRRLTALLAPGSADLEQLALAQPDASAGEANGRSGAPNLNNAAPLDAEQRAAVEVESPALVVAGPGTGKTSTLVGRVAHLVRDLGIAPERILALTFSTKAAREMRERVARLLGSESILDDPSALTAMDPALPQISTIHAFCGDLLRQYAPLVGLRPDFRLVTQTEGYFLLRRLLPGLELSYYQPLGAPALYFPDLLAAISRAKDELVGPERYAEHAAAMSAVAKIHDEELAAARAAEVAEVYTAYQRALALRGDPDFGDIVRLAVQLLQQHPEVLATVQQRYAQVLVDEFQDINRAMGVLLHTLAGPSGPLWAVGDPDQAIYRFRGASPANIERFSADYPTASVVRLGANYRSYHPILAAAHAVAAEFIATRADAAGGGRPELVATRTMPMAGKAAMVVTLANAADDTSELAGLVAAIRSREAHGRQLVDQAVLCRTRRGAQRAVAALHTAGIPTRVVAPLLEQDDVKDLLAVISLLADGTGSGLLRAGAFDDHAFTQADARTVLDGARERHVSPLSLLTPTALGELTGLGEVGRSGLARLGQLLSTLRTAPDVATALARYAFSLTGLGRALLAGVAAGEPAPAARAAHLARLLALAHAFEDQRRAEEQAAQGDNEEDDAEPTRAQPKRGGPGWSAFLDYVRVLLALRQDAGGGEEQSVSADDGVWVLTVHASKGLEFPVVYLPGLAERRFPVQRQHDAAPAPAGVIDREQHGGDDAHLGEEACLFYVALTRARDELVLSVAERYGRMRAKPSRFLAPIEARLDTQLARVRWSAPAQHASDHPQVVQPEQAIASPVRRSEDAIALGELETYQRCPRQYAYQYVYGLRSAGGGLAALGQSVRETLRVLRERMDARPDEGGADRTGADAGEAHALFEEHFAAALGDAEAAGPYAAVYRRYGRLMVERAWQSLRSQRARRDGREEDDEPASRELEREMTVQVGRRTVALAVDRVERAGHSGGVGHDVAAANGSAPEPANGGSQNGNGRGDAGNGQRQAIPLRLVRHRLTRGERPDLRSLLYRLAAEEEARRGEMVEVVQEHLASGRTEPITLSQRQRVALREDLEDALDGIASGNYPARPDPHVCHGCPFLLICPA